MQKYPLKRYVLFVLPLFVLAVWGIKSLSASQDEVTPTLKKLAGAEAKDCSCSSMPMGEAKWKAMRACAATSFQAKKPFWEREDVLNPAEGEALGVALRKDGNYYIVTQGKQRGQIVVMRGVGTKLIANPQTKELRIWNRRRVPVSQLPK